MKFDIKAVLAVLAVCCIMTCIAILVFAKPTEAIKDCILVLIGVVGAAYKDVYGYYFGSSDTDAKKP